MNWPERKIVVSLTIAVLLSVILSFLFFIGVFSNIQAKLGDSLYGHKQPLDSIVIIGIDDKSLQEIGRWPWPRERFVELLDKLKSAEVIGIDVAFYEEYDKNTDREFASSLKPLNVVLAAEYTFTGGDAAVKNTLLPIKELRESAITGYANVYTDKGGITRAIPTNIGNYKGFSEQIYEIYTGKSLESGSKRFLINFVGKPETFRHISFVDVIENRVNASVFENSIVLVGATSPGLHDNYFVPTSKGKAMSGVEIHANTLQTMLNANALSRQSNLSVILLIFLVSIAIVFVTYKWDMQIVILTIGLALVLYFLAALYFFNKQIIIDLIYIPLAMILTPTANLVSSYTLEKKQKKRIVEAFGKYVSPVLVDEIVKNPELVKLGGEKREITIMFSDIRGFTTISEKLTPEKLVQLLNEYLSEMTKIILDGKGVVDKFIGDAIMAFWGAPIKEEEHEKLACKTALEMLRKLEELQPKWKKENLPAIDIGVGINAGEAIIGNMGSDRRFDYTAIGDTVNLASRLEGINKQYGTRIVISESTYKRIKDDFLTRQLDTVRVKGKKEPAIIYELVGINADEKTKRIIKLFESGIRLYKNRKWKEAIKEFRKVLEIKEDKVSRLYMQRCSDFIKNPPSKDWDGVYEMKTK